MAETVTRDYTLEDEVRGAYAAASALDWLRREARRRHDGEDENGIGARTHRDGEDEIGF